MADREVGNNTVLTLAIIVLVVIVGIFLFYFLGTDRTTQTTTDKPNFYTDSPTAPTTPGTKAVPGTRADSNR